MQKIIFSFTIWCAFTLVAFAQAGDRMVMVDTLKAVSNSNVHILDNKLEEVAPSGKLRKRKADKLFQNYAYKAATDIYEDLEASNTELDATSMAKIATAFRLNNDTEKAEYWYARFVSEQSEASYIFHYAHMLYTNNKCEDATRWYKTFNEKVRKKERVNLDFIKNCSEKQVFRNTPDAQLVNLTAINSDDLDYVAVPYKNGIVFSSTRGLDKITKHTDNWTKDHFSDLFFAERTTFGMYTNPMPLNGKINGKHHDGVATFNSTQNTMYFSRNNRNGKSKNGVVDLKIYQTEMDDENMWRTAEELPFNSKEFSTCHPTLSKDGSQLFFASNRPGGYGGMDIYVSTRVKGVWSAPINLGPTINTAGNELFPFISKNEVLFFSSNGHRGMGGLDVFAAKKVDQKDNGSWSKRENIGTPFNTEKDDFGFYMDESAEYGYLTSNRVGGMGEDDVYEWMSDTPMDFFGTMMRPMNRIFTVVDAATKEKIGQVMVSINDDNTPDAPAMYNTNDRGEVKHFVHPNTELTIEAKKKGYTPVLMKKPVSELFENGMATVIPMARRKCTALSGTVINKDCDKPMPGSTVRIFNTCTGEEEELIADANGAFDFCLDCACDYQIMGTKDKFTEDQKVLSTIKGNCEKEKPMDVTLYLQLADAPKKVVKQPTTTRKPTPSAPTKKVTPKPTPKPAPRTTPAPTRTLKSGFRVEDLKVGKSLVLNDIYYDFNKASIRGDASSDLDRLILLMNEYPNMEIELSSHTDARGSMSYNQTLSSNRAVSATNYLVTRGISKTRIKAVGYGETRLTNECKDGVNCPDDKHQANRRTEVKILKLD